MKRSKWSTKLSKIGFTQKSSYFENYEKFTGKKVVKILLENSSDARVWRDAFPKLKDTKFEFTTAIEEASNLDILPAEGCKQLDKISPYLLGKHLIVCKDSDFSYITNLIINIMDKGNSSIEKPFVYETNVYSIENIEFYSEFVKNHFAKGLFLHESSFQDEWINDFYSIFSNLIYETFLKFIFLNIYSNSKIESVNQIYNCLVKINKIPTQTMNNFINFFKSKEWNNVKNEISLIDQKFNSLIDSENLRENFLFVKDELIKKGISSENIYLFYKGHHIETIFKNIFKAYLKIKYQIYTDEICSKLQETVAKEKRNSLKKNRKEFDIQSDHRDLSELYFFESTLNKINAIYKS